MNAKINNVNCKHHDGYGGCKAKPKIMLLFNQSCIEKFNLTQCCEIAQRFIRPKPSSPPTPGVSRNIEITVYLEGK